MSDIKLVNENGKIVGKDTETGETVPIELGETIHESVSTEDLAFDVLESWPMGEMGSSDNLSDARNFNETYKNTTEEAFLWMVRLEIDPSNGAENLNYRIQIAPTESGAEEIWNAVDGQNIQSYDDRFRDVVSWVVPPGYHYRLESFGDEISDVWVERPMGVV